MLLPKWQRVSLPKDITEITLERVKTQIKSDIDDRIKAESLKSQSRTVPKKKIDEMQKEELQLIYKDVRKPSTPWLFEEDTFNFRKPHLVPPYFFSFRDGMRCFVRRDIT
eukprot:GHVU01207314.1.p2 GENE.GHVU01207314.1~~GHVU01207314.1.p2  ORF type:complete len:110 (+),score=13.93 GHVU01207314.1:683-1012(+)